MQIDGSEQDSSQWTSNLHTIVNPQIDAFLDDFPSLLGCDSTGNGDGDGSAQGRPPSPTRLREHGHGLGSDLFESSSNSSIITDENGPRRWHRAAVPAKHASLPTASLKLHPG